MTHPEDTIPLGFCQCGCGRKTNIAQANRPEFGHVRGQPFRFLLGHNMRSAPYPEQRYVVDPETDCWIWQLSLDQDGYGRLWINGEKYPAHRWFFEQRFGPLPDGMVPDHICPGGANPSCVNPDHMRPLTVAENSRWKSSTKLDWSKVEAIRDLAGTISQREIGLMFGISQTQVSRIIRGDRWAA